MSVAALVETRPSAAAMADSLCAHCGLPLPAGAARFCCPGCAAAYELVKALDLGRYYDGRVLDAQARAPRPPDEQEIDLSASIIDQADGTHLLQLFVDGMQCPACVWLIESALQRQASVSAARANLTTGRLSLRWAGEAAEGNRLATLVQRLGYRVAPYEAPRQADATSAEETRLLRAVAVAGFASANVMLLSISIWAGIGGEMGWATRDLLHWMSALIALPAIVYAGQPFFVSAWRALAHRRTNMDVPITIGIVLVSCFSLYQTLRGAEEAYFESAVMLLFFLLIGRYLDRRARGKARSAAEQLIRFTAQPVQIVAADGMLHRVPASAVTAGATALIAAGERISVDGRVIEGRSWVDKSLIDGEAVPAAITPGDMVHSGMLNLDAPLQIAVTAVGQNTFLAEIVRLMEAAESGRSRLVALADRVARLYAPVVHSLALLTFIAWSWAATWSVALLNAVAVLIITCPCAIGLAVPVVQVVTTGRLMRRGILLKSPTALERLAGIDTVVFDKTGTLTLGRLSPQTASTDTESLFVASSLAAASRHPLSQALRAACPAAPALDGVTEYPGQGLRAMLPGGEVRLGSRSFCSTKLTEEDGLPELWLALPDRPPQRFAFTDTLRPDARAVIAALLRQGKRVQLLSGDRPAVVESTAFALGIADWRAALSPRDKCAVLSEHAARGAKVLMIGDGLNDAPALAAAHVSISPATGADITQNAADVVFQRQSLTAVTEILTAARRGAARVRENLGFAILYNALCIPLAMAGQVTPLFAAIAMSTSSLIVVANGLRMKRSAS